MVAPQVILQFQVTAAGGIEQQRIIALLHCEAAQVWQGGALGILNILQQRPGSADGQRHVGTTKTAEIAGAELGDK